VFCHYFETRNCHWYWQRRQSVSVEINVLFNAEHFFPVIDCFYMPLMLLFLFFFLLTILDMRVGRTMNEPSPCFPVDSLLKQFSHSSPYSWHSTFIATDRRFYSPEVAINLPALRRINKVVVTILHNFQSAAGRADLRELERWEQGGRRSVLPGAPADRCLRSVSWERAFSGTAALLVCRWLAFLLQNGGSYAARFIRI